MVSGPTRRTWKEMATWAAAAFLRACSIMVGAASSPVPGPQQHVLRVVEPGQQGVRVGVLQQEVGVPAVPAAGVEEALAPADVERPGPDEPAGQRLVAGYEPRHGGQRAGGAVVVFADEVLVVRKRLPRRLFRLDRADEGGLVRSVVHPVVIRTPGGCRRTTPRAGTPSLPAPPTSKAPAAGGASPRS